MIGLSSGWVLNITSWKVIISLVWLTVSVQSAMLPAILRFPHRVAESYDLVGNIAVRISEDLLVLFVNLG